MTPPAAATKPHAGRPTRSRTAQRPPRRVSGPAGGRRAARPAAAAHGGAVAVAPPLALRLARAGARIGDARFLDRLVRGRAWIALVAIGLMGIVFMQVSMLRLNAGISRAVTSAETLNRQNATLRGEISKLDSGERIADSAGALGMSLPPAGSVNYLDARKANGREAARGIHPPKPVKTAAETSTGAGTTTAQTQAPAQSAQQAPAAAPSQTQAQPEAQAATGPQTTTPQTTPQATTPPPAQTTTQAQTTTTQAQPPQQTTPQADPATTQPQAQAPAQQQQQQQGAAQPPAQPQATPAGGIGATGQGGQ
jgi:cell division protein FtsL